MHLSIRPWLVTVVLAGCYAQDTPQVAEQSAALQLSNALDKPRGAFSCDFILSSELPLELVAPAIERDRMYMAERPGFVHKQIPLAFDPATGAMYSGGRYLFRERRQAAAYHDWVLNEFALDGTLFLERPIFIQPDCHDWGVIGAREFAGLDHQLVMRTERFRTPGKLDELVLALLFAKLQQDAERRGYSAVWLLHNREERLATVVYFTDRVGAPDPTAPDFASLGALAGAAPLGRPLEKLGWPRLFDRTQWVLTTWLPFAPGDHGEPSLWPSSPPFPSPYCSDGVCEVSRGESAQSCPSDCPAQCGDGSCQADEDTLRCPGDCRI